MTFLSPQAQKARSNADLRHKLWQPSMHAYFTPQQIRVYHAVNNRKGQARATAQALQSIGFKWNSAADGRYFYADLTEENAIAAHEALNAAGIALTNGRSIAQWRQGTHVDEPLPVDYKRGRSVLFKS